MLTLGGVIGEKQRDQEWGWYGLKKQRTLGEQRAVLREGMKSEEKAGGGPGEG